MSDEILNRNKPNRVTALEVLMPNGGWWGEADGEFFCDEGLTLPTEEEIQSKLTELRFAQPLKELREERNQKLSETDWTQYRDVSLSNDSDWQTYRQSLRDLPQNFSPIIDIITEDGYPIVKEQTNWPEKPS